MRAHPRRCAPRHRKSPRIRARSLFCDRLLLLSLLLEGPARISTAFQSLTVSAVLALLYVAFFATAFGYGAWAYLLRRHPASTVSPFALIVPVVGLLSAAIVVHESPSTAELVGAVVVIAGLALVTLSVRSPTASAASMSDVPAPAVHT